MKQNLAELTGGSYEYGRALVVGSTEAGPGQFLYAFEAFHDNGPWDVPQNYRKYNGVLRYTLPVGDGQAGRHRHGLRRPVDGDQPDPAARRERGSGRPLRLARRQRRRHQPSLQPVGRLRGEPSAADICRPRPTASPTTSTCTPNFTFFLNDPVNGDQFNQYDNRKVYGWNGSWSRADTLFGYPMQNSAGWDIRQDRIAPVGIYDTVQRDASRHGRVKTMSGETSYSIWFENQTAMERMVPQHRRPARRELSLRRRQQHSRRTPAARPPASACPSSR